MSYRQDVLCTCTFVHVTQKHLGESFRLCYFQEFCNLPPPQRNKQDRFCD